MIKTRLSSPGLFLSTNIFLGLVVMLIASQSVQAQWTTNGNNINNTNSGNVGIGTTAPELPLDVRRNALVFNADARAVIGSYDTSPMAQGIGGGIQFGGTYDTTGALAGFASISGIKENGTNGNYSSALVFTTRTSGSVQGERMRISNTGNVGIGTKTPNERLSVVIQDAANNGITNVLSIGHTSTGTPAAGLGSSLMFDGKRSDGSVGHIGFLAGVWEDPTTGTEDGALVFAPILNSSGFGTERMRITSSGNVGIGTIPSSKLHVSSGTDASTNLLRIETGVHGGTNFAVGGTANNESFMDMTVYRGGQYVSRFGVTNFGQLYLQPSDSNVGIGTTNPDSNYKLDVVGNVRVSGNLAAKYQDVAEWVPAARALPAGTVVTLNPTQSNLVEASSKAYDTRVAGVISEQPGITLGERGENKVLVATTGRVRIKVDATNAPIAIGDLLVTSEKEGVAMKSVPVNVGGVEIHRPGTIVGKALEPLAKGQAEILVLLSLQ